MENEIESANVILEKFNLGEGDVLVVKVDITGCTEEQALKRLAEARDNETLNSISEAGGKILFTYTGIDFSLLKMSEEDKLLIYADTSPFSSEEDKDLYMNSLKEKVGGQISNEVVVIPVDSTSLRAAIQTPEDSGV
jgi:hypothetical protein